MRKQVALQSCSLVKTKSQFEPDYTETEILRPNWMITAIPNVQQSWSSVAKALLL